MNLPKDEAIAATKRKNRALRKIIRLEDVDPIFKMLVVAIIDKLNAQSGYRVAWPSVPTLAKIIGRSARTTQRCLKKVYASEFFTVHRFSPERAVTFMKEKFDIDVNLGRCRKFGPNVYEINTEHALWNSGERFPKEVAEEIRKLAGT
ncbi:MAG: hypothetical protein SGI77_01340 [Pirellulaceae bacterium]|nr:hypothetical protein [Pirellulaceae bacterium]